MVNKFICAKQSARIVQWNEAKITLHCVDGSHHTYEMVGEAMSPIGMIIHICIYTCIS